MITAIFPPSSDLQYPTVEPEYNGWNMEKVKLFDNDDSSCMDFGNKMYNRPQITFILEWHQGVFDASNKAESTHHCRELFFVNVTHSSSLKVQTFKTVTNVNLPLGAGHLETHIFCQLFSEWNDEDKMKRSKFSCTCTSSWTVYVNVYRSSNQIVGGKLCGIYLYN